MTEGNDEHPGAPPPGWQPPQEPPPGWTPPPPPPPPGYGPHPGYGPPPGSPQGYPPQGYPPQGYPPQGYPPQGYPPPPGWYVPPGHGQPLASARPVYKPGTIPLRPLGLGDMFSGAIETIRRNPRATLGVAALVLTAFLAVPTVATLIWGLAEGFGSELSPTENADDLRPEDVGLLLSTVSGALLAALATIVLTGMIVHVVERAARGHKLGAAEAWALTRPRIWRLVGLSLLSALMPVGIGAVVIALIVVAALASPVAGILVGLALGFGGLALIVFLYIRLFQMAAASMVIENLGVFAAMGRSWALTRGAFWRVFGISALGLLVASFAGQFISFPISMLGIVGTLIWPDTLAGLMATALAQNIAQVVSGSITTPFSAAIAALLYLDQRIRKEGYDIELIARGPDGAP